MTRYLGLGLIFLLSACVTNPGDLYSDIPAPETGTAPLENSVDEATPDPSTDLSLTACGAHLVQDLVGQTLANAQGTGRLPAEARIIRPGDVVTQDYSAQRMNVALTATTVIDRISCG